MSNRLIDHLPATPAFPAFPASLEGTPETYFIIGGGETGALMRSMKWDHSGLGPARNWPQSLRTSISICLNSRFPIALYWGPSFVMLYNDALLPMVGANKHPDALGRPAFEVLPEIRDVIEPLLQRVIETGEAIWSEDTMLPLIRHDVQEESYFTFTYSPIRDESGAVGGVFCAVLETTEKVIEERRLRLLNALADAMQATTASDACAIAAAHIERASQDIPFALFYLFDERARVARLSCTANVEIGSPLAPISIPFGMRDHSIWPFDEESQDSPQSQRLEIGSGGTTQSAVIFPIVRSGSVRPIGFFVAGLSPLLRRSPSYDRFHKLLSASISQSVSNAIAYAEEKAKADALAELDRAKTAFFSNISHEFRTPLTLMLAPIQDMAAMPAGSPIDHAAVDLLHRNSLRLLKLVNSLLEFSRIEAGRVEATYRPVDLSQLTSDLANSFRDVIERAGLSLLIDCHPLPAPTYVDRDMWEKIVLNLLSNAFKFTFEGSITVRLRSVDECAVLEVADTGTGIADAEIPRLFERFHRIAMARSRSHEGSGIGLALIQELVRLHGGEIHVTSRVDSGSSFIVCIPCGSAHLPKERLREPQSSLSTEIVRAAYVNEALRWNVPSTGPQIPWGQPDALGSTASAASAAMSVSSERILFADDNADLRDYVARLLGERWTVEVVNDGAAALESALKSPPALILCDVMMPRLDGFGLIQAIRNNATLRAIPIIILSARAGEDEAAKGRSAGANDYIAKPFSARDLLVRVASALATARMTREIRSIEKTQRTNLYRHFMQAPFPVGVFRGAEHTIELANPQLLRAWGKGSTVVGLPLLKAIPELEGQGFISHLDSVFRSGIAYEGHTELARLPTGPTGEIEDSYFNFVYAPLRTSEGEIEGILVSAFDATAQVVARMERERDHEGERSARRSAELGALVGRALVANETFSEQLRHCCEAIVTMSSAAFARIWTYNADHNVLELQASAGMYTHVNGSHARVRIGSLKIGKIASTRMPHLTNSVIGDPQITDQEWAKRQGLVSFAGYPLVVGARLVGVVGLFAKQELSTAILAALSSVADQIAIAIDRDASERFRELFIGMLGHDLRNPLSSVMISSHILAKKVPASQQHTVARIQNSAARMDRMIAQVLDFTRARSGGTIPISRTSADLAVIGAQVIDELAVANPHKTIHVTATGDATGMWDTDRLAQVFSNLLSNALTYSQNDTPIQIRLRATETDVEWSIHNNGPPIPNDLLPNLFDPFRRAHHTTRAGTQGLGLGLFISREIVKAHGGTISVTSTATAGTLFTVVVPT